MPEQDLLTDHPRSDAVRCYYRWGRLLYEYVKSALVALLGFILCGLFALAAENEPFLARLFIAAIYPAFLAFLLFMITRYDYAWIEIDGLSIRASHLYWPRSIERRLDEIQELRPVLHSGRVMAIKVVFWNVRLPFTTMRIDMSMCNAEEAIGALTTRFSDIEKRIAKGADSDVNFEVHSTNIRDPRES